MLSKLLVALVRGYQLLLSPLLGDCCRFEPSCSRYMNLCLKHHGGLRGTWLGVRRLLRCNALFAGGYDPPPLPAHVDPAEVEVDWQRVDAWVQRCTHCSPGGASGGQHSDASLPKF